MESSPQNRNLIIIATLLALFLGALDALVISPAMPSIVTDLGGLSLYSWVYSAYFLARAVSLPVFGKLADRYCKRTLFLFSVSVFLLASLLAGLAPSMLILIVARGFQGLGAGGIFALVYIVLSAISTPYERGRTLSLASSVWGISSIIGPTLGGVIVSYASWRWIFLLNVPLALLSLAIIGRYLTKQAHHGRQLPLDIAGITLLSGFILFFLMIFIIGGRSCPWLSWEILFLGLMSAMLGVGFVFVEKKASDPVFDLSFFSRPVFSLGNTAGFCASFAIFTLFAYVPLFLEGALVKTPMEVGMTMLALSLGWSGGSLILGRFMDANSTGIAAIAGGVVLVGSSFTMLFFHPQTTLFLCFIVFFFSGVGMGFVTLSTLLLVQGDLSVENLGVATSFHQFSRTLGGTVGVGVCGGVMTNALIVNLQQSVAGVSPKILEMLNESMENLFRETFRSMLNQQSEVMISLAVSNAMYVVFLIIFGASILCLAATLALHVYTGKTS